MSRRVRNRRDIFIFAPMQPALFISLCNPSTMNLRICFYLFLGGVLSVSCVSKKKYLGILAQQEQDRQGFENRLAIMDRELEVANEKIDTLTLQLATTNGANTALLASQQTLLDRIDAVQADLENERQAKRSTSQDLNSTVAEKEKTIAARDAQLKSIQSAIEDFEKNQTNTLTMFASELEELFGDKQSVDYVNDEIRITLNESLLFRPESARVRTSGIQNLKKIGKVMIKKLQMFTMTNEDQ